MKAEFIFTVTESKWLIAKCIARLERVQKALKEGIVAMHPSTSVYHLYYELTGEYPDVKKVWITGMNTPKAMCGEANTMLTHKQNANKSTDPGVVKALSDAGSYSHTLVLRNGKPVYGWTLNELIDNMGAGDIYFKGPNGVDMNKRPLVLIGSKDGSGTIGRMVAGASKKGYEIITPAGLEKFLPFDLRESARFVNSGGIDYSMGIRSKAFSFDCTVINEVDALESYADVKAVPFAAGGLDGAEGAALVAVEGEQTQVQKVIELCETVKGAKLPPIHSLDCVECPAHICHFRGTKKPWIK
ncbi:hypothetical protein [Sporomusa sp.]|uniref:hypothetical protein n=1 Tax=Sporomusa sp. TaxID=2078658 RepID=UPI002D13E645|nr:hypothetical protein [Sporomusa sp.]HWR08786.1 hypothetical protein [Sporomusa sp.]